MGSGFDNDGMVARQREEEEALVWQEARGTLLRVWFWEVRWRVKGGD